MFLADPFTCRTPVIELRAGDGVQRIEIERVDSYMLEAENMSAAIRGRAPLLLDRREPPSPKRASSKRCTPQPTAARRSRSGPGARTANPPRPTAQLLACGMPG